jgi:hypothetical protein
VYTQCDKDDRLIRRITDPSVAAPSAFAKRTAFNLLTVVSLLLCALVVMFWLRSRDAHFRRSFATAQGQYTLHSIGDMIYVTGPPAKGFDDPGPETLVSRISNDDVIWTNRDSQPIWEFRSQSESRQLLRRTAPEHDPSVLRALLAGLDDPRRFVASHLLLHELVPHYDMHGEVNVVFMPPSLTVDSYTQKSGDQITVSVRALRFVFQSTQPGGAEIDLSSVPQVRNQWHDRLDEPRLAICYAWPMIATLLLPLAWVAQPRGRARGYRRWALNGAALVSFLFCASIVLLWAQSNRGGIVLNWVGGSFSEDRVTRYQSSLDSSRGTVEWMFGNEMRWADNALASFTSIHASRWFQIPLLGRGGFSYTFYPADNAMTSRQPSWELVISAPHWAVALGFGLLPSMWIAGLIRSRKYRPGSCRVRGYDMRATPNRCPECGAKPNLVS